MNKKTKIEIGAIAACAVVLGGSTILANNSQSGQIQTSETSIAISQPIEEISTTINTTADTSNTTADTSAIETAEEEQTTAIEENTQPPIDTTTSSTEPSEKKVFVAQSGEGTRYHSDRYCGNMDGVRELTISEAEDLGYTPCKRCY